MESTFALPKDQLSLFRSYTPEEKVEFLFRTYYSGLCKSLYRILKSTELAEDVVQEVFLKVWSRKDSLDIDEATVAYLYKACYHGALNYLRQQKPQDDLAGIENTFSADKVADDSMLLEETQQRVAAAIAALPPKTRLVFSLSRYEEMSYKAIAEQLEISVKAVEKHMSLALERLRLHLHDYLSLLFFLGAYFFFKNL